jgi:hypothetical protein
MWPKICKTSLRTSCLQNSKSWRVHTLRRLWQNKLPIIHFIIISDIMHIIIEVYILYMYYDY